MDLMSGYTCMAAGPVELLGLDKRLHSPRAGQMRPYNREFQYQGCKL